MLYSSLIKNNSSCLLLFSSDVDSYDDYSKFFSIKLSYLKFGELEIERWIRVSDGENNRKLEYELVNDIGSGKFGVARWMTNALCKGKKVVEASNIMYQMKRAGCFPNVKSYIKLS